MRQSEVMLTYNTDGVQCGLHYVSGIYNFSFVDGIQIGGKVGSHFICCVHGVSSVAFLYCYILCRTMGFSGESSLILTS
jgi:hypothetical protein